MIRRLVAWIRGDRLDRELDDELSFHVEAHTRDLIAEGLPAEEARRRALAAFGGRTPIKERTKDTHGRRWLADLAMDVRYALRALRRQPGFAVVTLLTLTLGIGANTAIFSMVNAVLLRPLPVREPGRLVLFSPTAGQGTRNSRPFPDGRWDTFSTDTYTLLRSQPSPLASIAAFESGDYIGSLDLPDRSASADRVDVDFVSGNYFEVLGASPALGRVLSPDDDRLEAPPVFVASDRFWREHLDADPHALGRTIKVDDVVFTVVGVMPRAFFGVRVQRPPDIWTPLSHRGPGVSQRTDLHWLSLIGRLDDGQSIEHAKTAMTGRLRQYIRAQLQAPLDENTRLRLETVHVDMVDGSRGISYTRVENGRLLVLLLSAVSVILLIACANVGTLFLARAASREREVAVRGALGASRSRLVRQWLTESALLASAGAICGALAAWVAAPKLLATFVPENVPVTATIDGVVLMFTTGITLLASLLFGLAPSLSAGHVDPLATLRLSGAGRRRRRLLGMTEPFMVAQIAMSLVLVLAATLLVRTLLNLADARFGFDRDRVLLTPINPRPAGYRSADVGSLYRRIYEGVLTLPGVESATFARFSPFSGRWSSFESTVEGYVPRPGETVRLDAVQVGPRYPETLGIPLVQGRAIDLNDAAGAPRVAMVNEAFVTRFFGSRNPVGHRFSFKNRDTYEIVGVVKDAQYHLAREPIPPTVLTAMLQETTGMALDCEIEVRTQGDATALASGVRQAIAAVDSRVGLRRSVTLRDQVSSTFAPERTAAGFIVSFAVLALLVASVGLYGVVAHGLAKRTNEIGVRVALGAARSDVVWLIARETLARLAIGLLIGLAVAQAGRGLLSSQLFGVTPSDPLSLLMAAGVLSAVVALATLRPLTRALRVDPVSALRSE